MAFRFTPITLTAALLVSLGTLVVNVITYQKVVANSPSTLRYPESGAELFCINGFAYHMRVTEPDSDYGGAEILEVVQEFKGTPSFDDNGRAYPQRVGPKACKKS
ncbi:hypothetical protein [Pseudomonas sp.]|uniref:hypothetical protein n=1 Tax=Pseudomonas sp. TaxID=306 RepID=UPI002910CE9B|nr:hypothetical protein [Pseudomonas sp.]MDU4254537.1 hypothetical protein [Pseudomonas sp.]